MHHLICCAGPGIQSVLTLHHPHSGSLNTRRKSHVCSLEGCLSSGSTYSPLRIRSDILVMALWYSQYSVVELCVFSLSDKVRSATDDSLMLPVLSCYEAWLKVSMIFAESCDCTVLCLSFVPQVHFQPTMLAPTITL